MISRLFPTRNAERAKCERELRSHHNDPIGLLNAAQLAENYINENYFLLFTKSRLIVSI